MGRDLLVAGLMKIPGACTQCTQPGTEVLHGVSDKMKTGTLALQPAADTQQAALQQWSPPAFDPLRPDDDIDHTGLIFQGQEYRTVGCTGTLPVGDQTGETIRAAVVLHAHLGDTAIATLAEPRAQKMQGMGTEAQTQLLIVGNTGGGRRFDGEGGCLLRYDRHWQYSGCGQAALHRPQGLMTVPVQAGQSPCTCQPVQGGGGQVKAMTEYFAVQCTALRSPMQEFFCLFGRQALDQTKPQTQHAILHLTIPVAYMDASMCAR